MSIALTTRTALAIVLLALVEPAAANGVPLLVRKFVDITVLRSELSAVCGFSVYRRIEGLVDAALFFDAQGNPLREIDTSPSLQHTYFSPETGKSVTYPGTGTAITAYYQDQTAVVTLDGFLTLVHVPGGQPLLIDVGQIVFTAVVTGTNSDGLPVTDDSSTTILFDTGADEGSLLEACQALSL